jgi:hypothetical protein
VSLFDLLFKDVRRSRHCRPGVERLEDRTVLSFLTAPIYAVGVVPESVAVGDFNGDGIPDLAVANASSADGQGSVSVLLGQGDGAFRAAQSYAGGSTPWAIAVGDFNGDGKVDLAVANNTVQGTISILLDNGDGTFQAPQSYAAGPEPVSLTVVDFNGDGVLDIAVANNDSSGTVSVLLGNGDGTFQTAQSYAVGDDPTSVAVADFNGDGKLDLAAVNFGTDADLKGTVSILLGNGDGTFQAAQNYLVGSFYPGAVAIADFNGDGKLDLAVANTGTPSNQGDSVCILLGNGDGTFQAAQSYAVGGAPTFLAVGDFNADGFPDLAVTNSASGTVSILRGNGDGTFQDAQTYPTGSGPVSLAVGDFNRDGSTDLAVVNSVFSGTVSILLGKGDGTFQDAQSYAAGYNSASVAVGDFNGDGIPDLVVANQGVPFKANGTVTVLLGNGDGTFRAGQSFAAGSNPFAMAVGDFNGNGILDLAVANPADGTVDILLGNGNGTFQVPLSYAAGGNPVSVAVGDFNGDGFLDLAVANNVLSNGTVSILLGNGDGTFQAATVLSAGNGANSVAVGDFNGDGKLDIVTTTFVNLPRIGVIESDVRVFLGNGDGTFQAAQVYSDGIPQARSVAVGDFNGDGMADLAVANQDGTVTILLGNGDGSFGAAQTYATGLNAVSVSVRDFNRDGIPDLVVSNQLGVSVLLGNGDGTFQSAQSYGAGGNPVFVAVGDFNGDGYPDLAVANSVSPGTVTVLLNVADWGGGHAATRRYRADPQEPGLFPLLDAPEVQALRPFHFPSTELQHNAVQPLPRERNAGRSAPSKATSTPEALVTTRQVRNAIFGDWTKIAVDFWIWE